MCAREVEERESKWPRGESRAVYANKCGAVYEAQRDLSGGLRIAGYPKQRIIEAA